MTKKKKKEEDIEIIEEPEFGELEEWEEYGFESKEKYEDYLKNSAEDPLYGCGDLLTIKEMKELLQQEPYKPKGIDEQYPPVLLLDEKTGKYYTDFFRDFRQHLLLGHILAVQCIECENLDWERVTGGYSPYALARINDLCLNPLEWMPIPENFANHHIVTGRYAEECCTNTPYSDDALWDFADQMREDRAVWFAEHLPTGNDLYAMRSGYPYTRNDVIHWNILTTDYSDVDIAVFDEDDPYHLEKEPYLWSLDTFIENLKFIKKHKGWSEAISIADKLRYDWTQINKRHLLDIDKISEEDRKDFEKFFESGIGKLSAKWSQEHYEMIVNGGKKKKKEEHVENENHSDLLDPEMVKKLAQLGIVPREDAEKPEEGGETAAPEVAVAETQKEDAVPVPAEEEVVVPTEADFEETFSMRFRRTEEYGRLRHFMEQERTEASNADWARYALALYEADIFARRPRTFKVWLPRFSMLFERQASYQEPNKLKRTACQRDITAYLPNWK